MDEKKNENETLDGVKVDTAGKSGNIADDVASLADEAVADASDDSKEVKDAKAAAEDSVKDAAETVSDTSEDTDKVTDTVKAAEADSDALEKAADTAEKAADAAKGTTAAAADAAKETAAGVAGETSSAIQKDEKAEKKPAAKVDPQYDKIFWPSAGRVWSNTLTVVIIAALMAGTIFLVDLGLRAIIDGFMSI